MEQDGDNTFGPQFLAEFDFTLLFQQTLLTILPSSLFICVSVHHISQHARRPVCARPGLLLWAKVVTAAILLAMQIASIAVMAQAPIFQTAVSTASGILSCIDAFLIGALLYMSHRHSMQPSTLLSIYLPVTILFDAAKARSCFTRYDLDVSGSLLATVAALKFVLLVLEEVPKRTLFYNSGYVGKEAISGFWNRSVFWWLNTTLITGYRSLLVVDTLEELDPKFDSVVLLSRLDQVWKPIDKSTTYCLFKATSGAFMPAILAIIVPRLCYSAFSFCQPFLINRIISAVSEENLTGPVIGGLVAATALVYFGMVISKAYYMHKTFRLITMLRGALVAKIYDHTLVIEMNETKSTAAITLMSTDVEGIARGLQNFSDIWAMVIEFGVGTYLLSRSVGPATIFVVVPSLLSTAASLYIGSKSPIARKAWNQKVQERISRTSAILPQLKSIKILGLGPVVYSFIQQLRVVEIQYSKNARVLGAMMFTMSIFTSTITPIIVMAGSVFWTMSGSVLSPAQAFTTLSIVALVSKPLVMLLMAYPQFKGMLACFDRIQTFLLTQRPTHHPSSLHRPGSKENKSSTNSAQCSQHDHELKVIVGTKEAQTSKEEAIIFQNASISPGVDAEPILQNVDVSLSHGSLNLVLGPVGSGKSTLLKAILGEATVCKGDIQVNYGPSAYCAQTPWLQNLSVRDTIIGQSSFDSEWYKSVLHACLLDLDLSHLPGGDEYRVGNGGANLSGGQKQRLALARAVYSRMPILLLDNVFRSLDLETARTSFNRLFGEGGIIRKTGATVVLTTHLVECLSLASNVIVIDKDTKTITSYKNWATETNSHLDEIPKLANLALEAASGEEDLSPPAATTAKTTNQGTENQGDPLERRLGDMSIYQFYFRSVGPLLFTTWILLAASNVVAGKMPEIWMRIWLDVDDTNRLYFVGYALWGFAACVTAFMSLAFYMLRVVPKSAENLHGQLLDTLTRATFWYITITDMGTVLNRFSQDMGLVNQVLPMVVSQVVIYFLSVLIDIAIITSATQYTAAIIPFFLVALYFLQDYYLRTSRQMRHLDLEAKSPLYTLFMETGSGLQHIRAFKWQTTFQSRCIDLLNYSQKPYYLMFCIQRWLVLVLDSCVSCIAMVVVGLALGLRSTTVPSAIGLALINLVGFSQMLSDLIRCWTDLETSLGAISRLKAYATSTPLQAEPAQPVELPKNWPGQGRVELKSVRAKYNAQNSEARTVLDDLSLTIQPGEKVGIIGRTGSGKSSLLLCILNLIDFDGSVLIDGIDVKDVQGQVLQSRITTITQDPVDIYVPLRANLYPFELPEGTSISDSIMIDALSRVGLWERVQSVGGLDADLDALQLSHGQKQLFYLARAILHHQETGGRLILVDEATSDMDEETETRIMKIMEEAFSDCTVVMIAHHVQTLQNADVIIKLDGGKLVKTGSGEPGDLD